MENLSLFSYQSTGTDLAVHMIMCSSIFTPKSSSFPLFAIFTAFLVFPFPSKAESPLVSVAKIVYFGDSQATLWTGRVIGDLIESLPQRCHELGSSFSEELSQPWHVKGYATGSSSFHHWIAKSGSHRDHICGTEKNSAFIDSLAPGQTQTFQKGSWLIMSPQICVSGPVAKNVFNIENPDLIIFNFLGNSAQRSVRINNRQIISSGQYGYDIPEEHQSTEFDLTMDLYQLIDILPHGTPCIIFTSNPNRLKESIQRQRIFAQAVLQRDTQKSQRCAFVAGINPETQDFFMNNLDMLGDKFHMSTEGSFWFFTHHTPSLCEAIQTSQALAKQAKGFPVF